MQTSALWIYLTLTALTSLGLCFYVFWYLPREMANRLEDSFGAFSTAVELRFPSLAGSTERILELCGAMSEHLRLPRSVRRRLGLAARLRDIGLCSIPYAMLNERPVSSWSRAEVETFSRHPEVGGAMLELVPSLRHLVPIIRNHHAPFDGSGGPFFAAGEEIPIEARILHVVIEYVDAERHQGPLLARDMVVSDRGSRFDPMMVEALLTVLRSDGARGEIQRQPSVERVS